MQPTITFNILTRLGDAKNFSYVLYRGLEDNFLSCMLGNSAAGFTKVWGTDQARVATFRINRHAIESYGLVLQFTNNALTDWHNLHYNSAVPAIMVIDHCNGMLTYKCCKPRTHWQTKHCPKYPKRPFGEKLPSLGEICAPWGLPVV